MSTAGSARGGTNRTVNPVRITSLALKELRETLRDRRTIITLILMPLIVYPILSLVFRTFLLTGLRAPGGDGLVQYRYVVESDWSDNELRDFIAALELAALSRNEPAEPDGTQDAEADGAAPNAQVPDPLDPREATIAQHVFSRGGGMASVAELIRRGEADAGFTLSGGRMLRSGSRVGMQVRIDYSDDLPVSRRAASFLQRHLEQYNLVDLQSRLARGRSDPALALEVTESRVKVEGQTGAISFATIIPLILVLMTITGAVYPAIDLTAGERERGTLETLIATPVPRMKILVGKLIAVLTVAVLTATLNVTGMLTTVWVFQLDRLLMGGNPLTAGIFVRIFGLLVLFATFFSALLLVVTSFARSFKEAQAYLIPVILLSLGPGLFAMQPGLSLSGPLAVCPMVNVLLLARDILEGQASLLPAAVAVFSTLVYAVAAIGLAASIFGADSILYGAEGSWQEMFLRPLERSPAASPSTAMLVLALLLPVNFVSIALLQQAAGSVRTQLLLLILFTFLSFFAVPSLVAWHQRVRWSSGFGIVQPAAIGLIAAAGLGLVMWPLQSSLVSLPYDLYDWLAGANTGERSRERLLKASQGEIQRLREVPWPLYLAALSVAPAVCEEWFFRGMLLRSLLTAVRPIQAIAASALAFGAFHALSMGVVAFDRLLPVTIMGGVLGWVAWRTGSIWPGVVLHMLHNGTIVTLARLATSEHPPAWLPDPNQPIPGWWIVGSLAATGALLWGIHRLVSPSRPTSSGEA